MPVFKIPGFGHIEKVAEQCAIFGSKDLQDLVLGPNVEFSFLALAVGIFGRVEPSFRICHIANDVLECLFGNPSVKRKFSLLICVEINSSEQRIVVEHLFEMRNEPTRINRVTCEASAQMIVHSPARHLLQGSLDDV